MNPCLPLQKAILHWELFSLRRPVKRRSSQPDTLFMDMEVVVWSSLQSLCCQRVHHTNSALLSNLLGTECSDWLLYYCANVTFPEMFSVVCKTDTFPCAPLCFLVASAHMVAETGTSNWCSPHPDEHSGIYRDVRELQSLQCRRFCRFLIARRCHWELFADN